MKEIIKIIESSEYRITSQVDSKGKYFVKVKSLIGSGYSADHYHYYLFKDGGYESREITIDVLDRLLESILKNGDTEGFYIDIEGGINKSAIEPNNIRHSVSLKEKSFTSRGEKLLHHWPIFKKYSETGFGSIIRATLTLHQLCSSHCQYCSTISRNKSDSITLNEAKLFVKKLYFDQEMYNEKEFYSYNKEYKSVAGSGIRLKGLILSGGGQPNLWPHFTEFVEWLSDLDIELGLITNGFPKKIPENIYKNFDWIRISVTPENASPHYIDNKFNNQYIPEAIKNNDNITVGLSYVYGAWTTNDILYRIKKTIDDWGLSYCRMLTDCNLTRDSQLHEHEKLSDKLYKLGYIDKNGKLLTKIFHQLKYHGTKKEANSLWVDGQCYLQIYNVFWDTTGHDDNSLSSCYTCDSITVLSEEDDFGINTSERKFNSEKWGTVSNNHVEDLFKKPVRPYFNPKIVCRSCLFMRNNRIAKELINTKDYSLLEIDDNISHVNFP